MTTEGSIITMEQPTNRSRDVRMFEKIPSTELEKHSGWVQKCKNEKFQIK